VAALRVVLSPAVLIVGEVAKRDEFSEIVKWLREQPVPAAGLGRPVFH
jgi:hypothetical protein